MASRTRTHCPNCQEQYQPRARACHSCGRTRDQKTDAELSDEQRHAAAIASDVAPQAQRYRQKPSDAPYRLIGRIVGLLLAAVVIWLAWKPALWGIGTAALVNGIVRFGFGRVKGTAALAGILGYAAGVLAFLIALIIRFQGG